MREIANRLVDDPEYQESLRQRMINGNAGGIEILMWHYAKGKPVHRVEHAVTETVILNDGELRRRLRAAFEAFDTVG